MFIPALFTIAKTWKQPTCPSAEEWIKRMWVMDTVGSAMKKKIMPFATTWIDLGSVILSEIRQKKTNVI